MDIFITGEIDGFLEQNFIKSIKKLQPEEDAFIHINSPGGSVFSGYSIYNIIKNLPNRTITLIDGLCGSIASVIALASDEVNMSSISTLMIHNPLVSGTSGNQHDLRKTADFIEGHAKNIKDIYSKRTKLPKSSIQAMMDNETTFNAKEAKALGFIDNILSTYKLSANMDLISKIREQAQSLGIVSEVKKADDEAVNAIIETAELKAKEEKEKALAKANGVDALLVDMATKEDFEKFKALVTGFIQLVVDKFDKELSNEELEDSIKGSVKNAFDDLIKSVKSSAKPSVDSPASSVFDGVKVTNEKTVNLEGFNKKLSQIRNQA